jgi:protein SCO1/2
MKLKTSITIIGGCLIIFIFIMLPIVLSVQDKKEEYVSTIKGSSFSLNDINNNPITEKSFQVQNVALFFGFTHCPDICPMTLNKLSIILERLEKENKTLKVFFIRI